MRAPGRRRLALLTGASAVALLLAVGGGWVLAVAFESPAQREASARAPERVPVTAEVVSGELSRTVSVSAEVGRRAAEQVALVPGEGRSVVTGRPLSIGSVAAAGAVVLEVSGHPVFLLPGAFPFYRALSAGDRGPDVRQLQQGIADSGIRVAADGVFGAATERAVRQLYERAGYDPETRAPTAEEEAAAASLLPADADSQDRKPLPPVLVIRPEHLLVASSMPASLVSVPTIGREIAEGDAVGLEQGDIVAAGEVPASAAGQLEPGQRVVVRKGGSPGVDALVESVMAVTDDDSDKSADALRDTSRVVFVATGDTFPAEWLRGTVVAQVTVELAAADSLIVPSIAVVTEPKGRASVRKRDTDGTFTVVSVVEKAQLDGRSAIEPVTTGAIARGDRVAVE